MPLARILLRNLLACERGLVEAYGAALRRGGFSMARQALLVRGFSAHQAHARVLGERLRALSEPPPELSDDLWIGDPGDPRALLFAEQTSHDTWHDALMDFAPEFAQGDARRITEDHRELARAWEDLLNEVAEPSVTV